MRRLPRFLLTVSLMFHVVGGLAATAEAQSPGDGLRLDGRTAYALPVDGLGLRGDAITVSVRVKLNSVGASEIFVNRGAANELFTLYLYQDGVRMLVAPDGENYAKAVAPKPKPGVWTHYLGTYDGETIRLYVDGELADARPAKGAMAESDAPVTIGALGDGSRPLTGAIEDVVLWNRFLTPKEASRVAKGDGSGDGSVLRFVSGSATDTEWPSEKPGSIVATRIEPPELLINEKDDGYRGIWYANQESGDEYVYKYSGGLGTYCAKHIPHAWYVEKVNKTFFTYGGAYKDKNRLIHMVSYYDHETGGVPRPTILLDKETDDAHDNPVINVDEQGYIWIFSSSHGTGRPSYISRSVEAYSIDEFELKWTGNFSYPQPWPISGKGWLFMHTHYTGGRTISMSTSPDAVHWTERRFLARIDQGHYQITQPFGAEKVGSAYNYHPEGKGLNWRTNLYYMETKDLGETWTNIEGEPLEILIDQPDNPALVHEYESEGLNVYLKDITFDRDGNPIVLYVTSKGYESGPKNGPRTWTTARWTGSEWAIHGGDIVSDNNYDMGSLYVENDIWRIIAPTETGPQPYNPGGEVALWVSADKGVSWKKARQVTENSDYNHTYVRRPVNAHPDFYGFWADGHGRQPSDSRLYFCDSEGNAYRLPTEMTGDYAKPEPIN